MPLGEVRAADVATYLPDTTRRAVVGKGKTKRSAPEEVVRQKVIKELHQLGWKDTRLRWSPEWQYPSHPARPDETRTRTEVLVVWLELTLWLSPMTQASHMRSK